MDIYEFICFCILPTIMSWHVICLFIDDDSRHQQNKFRKALDLICEYILKQNEAFEDGVRFNSVKVIHRQREFQVGIIKETLSHNYSTYRIFINGDEAARFHRLNKVLGSSYYFESVNGRHKSEVREILYACSKEVKKLNKASLQKIDYYAEHSYFS